MKAKYIIGGLIIAACLGTMFYFAKNFATPYVPFDEAMKSDGRQVQVIGELVKGTTRFDSGSGAYNFTIKDKEGRMMDVRTMKALPTNFEHATQVVAKGMFADGAFAASDILTKCPSKYEKQAQDEQRGAQEAK